MKVSVVVPVYNEQANLEEFLRRTLAVMDGSGDPYEIILVDDGSRDRSLEILKAWAAGRPDVVRVLELSRNFGQHPAILAGFRDVTGDVVVTLDADLQNPPEEIPKLLAKFAEGYDVVGGVRVSRQDSWARKLASGIVNRITVLITRMRLTDFGCMLRAYSRDVVDEINQSEEAATFIPALGQSFARNPTEIEVAHAPRTGGESAYSLYRLIRLNFDLMTGFSTVPLQLFGIVGMFVALGGIAFGLFLFLRRLIVGAEVEGVFTLFAILFTLLGVAMAGLGIVGEYVGRIYEQVRGRPRFSVRRAYGLGASPAEPARPGPRRRRLQAPAHPPPGRAGDAHRRLCLLGHRARLPEGAPRPRVRRRPRRDARRRPGRGEVVPERRGARAVARNRAGDFRRRPRPRGDRARPERRARAHLLDLLPRHAAEGPPRSPAARGLTTCTARSFRSTAGARPSTGRS